LYRQIGDDFLRVVTDGLVGNTTLDVLAAYVTSGYCASRLTPINALSNMTRLLESAHIHALTCGPIHGVISDVASARDFADRLSRNRFMKILNMDGCHLSSAVAVALGRNTTLENLIVQVDHGDLRLEESLPMMKGLRRMSLGADDYRWHSFLQNHPLVAFRRNTSLEDLPDLDLDFYIDYKEEIMEIKNLLVRNCNVKRALLLVQPQLDTGNLIPSSSWILRRAIAQLACDTASGASAIYQMPRFWTLPCVVRLRLFRLESSQWLL
jgi:hypothetical protein